MYFVGEISSHYCKELNLYEVSGWVIEPYYNRVLAIPSMWILFIGYLGLSHEFHLQLNWWELIWCILASLEIHCCLSLPILLLPEKSCRIVLMVTSIHWDRYNWANITWALVLFFYCLNFWNAFLQVYKRSSDICMQLYEKELLTDSSYLHTYGLVFFYMLLPRWTFDHLHGFSLHLFISFKWFYHLFIFLITHLFICMADWRGLIFMRSSLQSSQ